MRPRPGSTQAWSGHCNACVASCPSTARPRVSVSQDLRMPGCGGLSQGSGEMPQQPPIHEASRQPSGHTRTAIQAIADSALQPSVPETAGYCPRWLHPSPGQGGNVRSNSPQMKNPENSWRQPPLGRRRDGAAIRPSATDEYCSSRRPSKPRSQDGSSPGQGVPGPSEILHPDRAYASSARIDLIWLLVTPN